MRASNPEQDSTLNPEPLKTKRNPGYRNTRVLVLRVAASADPLKNYLWLKTPDGMAFVSCPAIEGHQTASR